MLRIRRNQWKETIHPLQYSAEAKYFWLQEISYEFWHCGEDGDHIAQILDEYYIYCCSRLEKGVKRGTDAIAQWPKHHQRWLHPNLYHRSLDRLTIPAIAAEPYVLPSDSKKIITSERPSLLPSTTESILVIKICN
jgi:hypothetical protein